ncbi:MAG: magnesium/cobalt transporter CorA [Anaerolineales bacterium]|jgi:magnesium transporter|nr:magnesium/cobalt transporter CorA [Anaerolineales bacterium]
MRRRKDHIQTVPGGAPGIEHDEIASLPGGTGQVRVSCMDYSPSQVASQEVLNIDDFIRTHRPDWSAVRWINVDGFSDMHVIQALAEKYDLHPLAIEDTLHKTQRPKVESYGGDESNLLARLFIVTHAIEIEDNHLKQEQVSIFLGHKTVLTFQEFSSEEWNPIRQRIKVKGSRLRNSDASFLAYSLLDASVDSFFPIIEAYSERAEELDNLILDQSDPSLISEIHQLKRNLLTLRGVVWPMREVVSALQREEHECISDTTRVYLRDLYDHVIQLIDLVETYREITNNLTETYMSSTSNHMNEVMKVLTVINTIFIPLTFLAGVYGMNFRHFPELDQVWAYPVFWLICLAAVSGMVLYFRRRRWL